MTTPSVTITELDGQIGSLPSAAGKALAVIGWASDNADGIPRLFARVQDLVATHGATGVSVDAAAHCIATTGRPVLFVSAVESAIVPGDFVYQTEDSPLNVNGWLGTSAVTDGTSVFYDDYEIVFKIVTGGTRGTAGITYKYSLDNGRNWSPVYALGTATSVTVGGVQLNFAAGTMLAGDVVKVSTRGPSLSAASIEAALDALKVSAIPWELVEVSTPITGTEFDSLETKMATLQTANKPRAYVAGFRTENRLMGADDDESANEYATAFDAAFGSKATTYGQVCAGASKLTSSAIKGFKPRRSPALQVAARTANVDEHIDIADVNLGPLPGTSITDSNGNPDEYDESIFGLLDNMRATVLRTFEGYGGVYVNRPQLLSPSGSDFVLMPHRRVMNLARVALRDYFTRRLNASVRVDKRTGYILESDALEIESGANAALRTVLAPKAKASGWSFVLSRTDNILATRTLTGQARVIPLGYVESIDIDLGFFNPALAVA